MARSKVTWGAARVQLLLICCANLAMLSLASGREGEVSVVGETGCVDNCISRTVMAIYNGGETHD